LFRRDRRTVTMRRRFRLLWRATSIGRRSAAENDAIPSNLKLPDSVSIDLLLPEFDQFLLEAVAEQFGGLDQSFQSDFRVRSGPERASGFQKCDQAPVAQFLTFV
jgi:hypothetical protein